ncbi:MAG TPA: hypothetical protein VGY55_24250 [Pirellulales bacterium]|jgi:hypothetical protein|nr:hypothetical protein [Pirellulales bacterium]
MAACRNAVIGLLRFWNCQNIMATPRENAYQPQPLFAKLGLLKQ